ncbi:MAG: nucleoside-diphosphate-sugar epimerase [Labilithrix sp.]|nr:nucleoside-diphosphate-sugar epimerase [Labilithrix sp.]
MLDGARDVFRDLRGARVFLTGGTGFYGVWLLASLAEARRELGAEISITLLTRSAERTRARHGALLEATGAELVEGDARTFTMPDGAFSHVVHGATAASAALNEGAPFEMLDVIVAGTQRVVEAATGAGASRFLLTSSGAVYGTQPPELTHVPESFRGGPDPLDVRNAYAEGKRASELVAAIGAQRAGYELVVARGFAFCGPHLPLDVHFAIGNFLRDGLAGGPVRVLGDGTPYRSYLYGTDLAVWLWTMLARGRAGAAYNLGSEDGRPLREIAARVAAATGTTLSVAKEPPPGVLPARYVPSTERARADLGLEVTVDLDDAIGRTIAFHRGS